MLESAGRVRFSRNVCRRPIHPAMTGEIPGELQLDDEGERMPGFTFEKISPPVRGPIAPAARKQRGIIAQILDRLGEARVRRSLRGDKAVIMAGKRKAQG